MKIIVEKQDACMINFDTNKEYLVFKNYSKTHPLGFCKISYENGILYADLKLNQAVTGYPAIGFTRDNKTKSCRLDMIGICDSPNLDPSIETGIKNKYISCFSQWVQAISIAGILLYFTVTPK